METYSVYLKPKGSILGEISSGTIFGALCWAIHTLYGDSELEGILAQFNTAPKFLVSSPFPYLKNSSDKVKFYPKPKFPAPPNQILEELAKKEAGTNETRSLKFKKAYLKVRETFDKIKDTSFVSEQMFNEIVIGELGLISVFTGYRDGDVERIGNVLISHEEIKIVDPKGELLTKPFMKEMDIQRNQIDRVSGTTAEGLLFFSRQIFFLKRKDGLKSGLWFIVKTADFKFIEPLLRYIADTGLGGDRSVGKGHFDIIWENIGELPRVNGPNCFINISHYIPDEDEIDPTKNPVSYTLRNIRGKHESKFISQANQPHFKRMVRVFEEGSIFPLIKEKTFYGRLVLVGEKADIGHDVYQNGITIPIFANIKVKYEV